jgi:hypothetical protein
MSCHTINSGCDIKQEIRSLPMTYFSETESTLSLVVSIILKKKNPPVSFLVSKWDNLQIVDLP